MAHLEIRIDGTTTFDGQVPDVMLPSRPELFPEALRPAPGQPPTPLARLTLLTALIEVMRRGLESPMLQPIDVEVLTHGLGKATIAVEMTMPGDTDA